MNKVKCGWKLCAFSVDHIKWTFVLIKNKFLPI